jgi:hypothetical protein
MIGRARASVSPKIKAVSISLFNLMTKTSKLVLFRRANEIGTPVLTIMVQASQQVVAGRLNLADNAVIQAFRR